VWKYSSGFVVVVVVVDYDNDDDDDELYFFPQDPSAYLLSTLLRYCVTLRQNAQCPDT
jgi:hypothetical protein